MASRKLQKRLEQAARKASLRKALEPTIPLAVGQAQPETETNPEPESLPPVNLSQNSPDRTLELCLAPQANMPTSDLADLRDTPTTRPARTITPPPPPHAHQHASLAHLLTRRPPRPRPEPWTHARETPAPQSPSQVAAQPDLEDLARFEKELENPSVPELLALRRLERTIRLMALAEERLFSDEHAFNPDDDKRYRILCREWMRLNSFLQRRVDARARLAARFDSERFRNSHFKPTTTHAGQIGPEPSIAPHQPDPLASSAKQPQHPANIELMTTSSSPLPPGEGGRRPGEGSSSHPSPLRTSSSTPDRTELTVARV